MYYNKTDRAAAGIFFHAGSDAALKTITGSFAITSTWVTEGTNYVRFNGKDTYSLAPALQPALTGSTCTSITVRGTVIQSWNLFAPAEDIATMHYGFAAYHGGTAYTFTTRDGASYSYSANVELSSIVKFALANGSATSTEELTLVESSSIAANGNGTFTVTAGNTAYTVPADAWVFSVSQNGGLQNASLTGAHTVLLYLDSAALVAVQVQG